MNDETTDAGPSARRGGDDPLLAGAWAVDALDDAERVDYERRLDREPDERTAARELRVTAARLGASAPVEPPERVRRDVLAALGSTAQEPPRAPVDELEVARHRRAARSTAGRRSRWPLLVAAAAVVVAGAGVVTTVDARQQVSQAQTQAAEQRADAEHVVRMMTAPGREIVTVGATDGGSATVVRAGTGACVMGSLPAVAADRTYQVWLVGGSGIASAGLLTDPSAPYFLTGAEAASAIAVSVEPSGGSQQPTTTPVVVASFA